MSDNKTSSNGIGFTGTLLIAFIVLKLCNVISWSWWWVLSPAWITAAIVLVLLSVLGIIKYSEYRKNKKVVTKRGQLKSKWQERLDEVQEAQRRQRQRELHEKLNRDA